MMEMHLFIDCNSVVSSFPSGETKYELYWYELKKCPDAEGSKHA
jgi:hypothetical protein